VPVLILYMAYMGHCGVKSAHSTESQQAASRLMVPTWRLL